MTAMLQMSRNGQVSLAGVSNTASLLQHYMDEFRLVSPVSASSSPNALQVLNLQEWFETSWPQKLLQLATILLRDKISWVDEPRSGQTKRPHYNVSLDKLDSRAW